MKIVMKTPIIAIVGRPNVGKSTLFNRLIQKRYAITSPVPGTTRDRIYHPVQFGPYRAILVDIGGLDFGNLKDDIEESVQLQARIAMREADLIFFVVDATESLTSRDYDAASLLQKSKKPVVLIAHKADRKRIDEYLPELYRLGFENPLQVSSIHALGLKELESTTIKILKTSGWKPQYEEKDETESEITRICFVGKPNVGKSSLVNALLGEERLIISEKPGTTIDATDTFIRYQEKPYLLIDTAGLRRRGKIAKGIPKLSLFRGLEAIDRSDVALLMMDAETGMGKQDAHISQYVLEARKGLILVVNKCDLMENEKEERERWIRILQTRMSFVSWAPLIFVSAKTEKNIFRLFELASSIRTERTKRVPQEHFALFLQTLIGKHGPGGTGKFAPKIHEGEQTGINPPTFTFLSNNPEAIHFSYRRYLENAIRDRYGFTGTPLKLVFTSRKRSSHAL